MLCLQKIIRMMIILNKPNSKVKLDLIVKKGVYHAFTAMTMKRIIRIRNANLCQPK